MQVYILKIMNFAIHIKQTVSKDLIIKLECPSLTSAIDYACQIKKLDLQLFTDFFTVQQIVSS